MLCALEMRLTRFMVLMAVFGVLLAEAKQFAFRRYPFKKKKDDKVYRTKRIYCDETLNSCSNLNGLEYIKCLRRCMSETCYDELYGHDELEEGEIDVRLNSFKGCLAQQSRRG